MRMNEFRKIYGECFFCVEDDGTDNIKNFLSLGNMFLNSTLRNKMKISYKGKSKYRFIRFLLYYRIYSDKIIP
jgi:hypothetical protein